MKIRQMMAFVLLFVILCSLPLAAQKTDIQVDGQRIHKIITYIASDQFRGRKPNTPEFFQVQEWVVQQYKSWGLEPAGENGTYIDRFEWERARLLGSETAVRIQGGGDAELQWATDFLLVPGGQPASAEAVYVGTAGEDSTTADHQGKIVILDHPIPEMNQAWQQTAMAVMQPAMMSGALAYVFPSLYEGFGFPALEAMACGTPVVCSSASSLPEVVGDAALLFDPLDVEELTAALVRIANDVRLRDELVELGFGQIQRFSWARCAREVMQVLEEVGRGLD